LNERGVALIWLFFFGQDIVLVLITHEQNKQKTPDQKEKNKKQGNFWKYGYEFGTLKRKRRFVEVFVIF